jgi:hypothetical protein
MLLPLAPSLHSLFVTGILLLAIAYLLVTNFAAFKRLDVYRKTTLLALLTVAVGVHGLIHLGTESVYGFNPYKWF